MLSKMETFSKEEFADIIAKSSSYAEALKLLGYESNSGSLTNQLKERIAKLNLSTEHFKLKTPRVLTEDLVFCENSTVCQKDLRRWYKKLEKPYVCTICGQEPFWQGKELTLILDHINGHNKDNRIENLRWVCPNCNQQLDTTNGKNIKTQSSEKLCPRCGTAISRNATYCIKCFNEVKKENNVLPVSREELKNLIRTTPFTQIGNKFGVSDNAIRKWCDKYGLPRKTTEIKSISDQDWKDI